MLKASSDLYFTFIVVRHPLARLLSAYIDRILRPKNQSWQARNYVPKIFVAAQVEKEKNEYTYLSIIQICYVLQDPLVKMDTSQIFDKNTDEIKHYPSFHQFAKYISFTKDEFDDHWRTFS